MFFLLSKIFWFFVQPLNLAIFLLAAGLFRWRKLMAAGAAGAFLVLAVATWTSFGQALLYPLEERFSRPNPAPEKLDGIVVLGGGLEGSINLARGGYEVNAGGDRYIETAVLARRYPQAHIVVSGGAGTLLLDGEGDGATAPRLLTALGVDPARLILENQSRNMFENALFTKRLVTPQPGETWLLVTSAFHMPRSMALFRKADFAVLPWPVDYRTSGREGLFFADNAIDSLQATTLGIREWIGLFAYWLSGRIDEPFPS
ncbi:YdcF family protein [Mesorhizobium sp. LHD-90]|uniref:YdcF family protein n=1 Tax=Mesorhizobium sp. LHD-90 TaxID=3071414 RepID=UPI0027DF2AD3|nr:YdcF family protein [Mesorhizobium sp. LHD-90]MDQ6437852.1 YdcF family protein [Mesorhizobium sp. LHD-90]